MFGERGNANAISVDSTSTPDLACNKVQTIHAELEANSTKCKHYSHAKLKEHSMISGSIVHNSAHVVSQKQGKLGTFSITA
jgi:hypothetical protein